MVECLLWEQDVVGSNPACLITAMCNKNFTAVLPFEGEEQTMRENTKKCIKCKETLPLSNFHRDRGYTHHMCIKCKRKAGKQLKKIKKNAPEPPEVCECCGENPKDRPGGKLITDHDHETGEFRGYICDKCNHGIGKLGDNLEGVMKAVKYFEMVEERKKLNKPLALPEFDSDEMLDNPDSKDIIVT